MKAQHFKKGSLITGLLVAAIALFTTVHHANAQRSSTSISHKNGVSQITYKNGSDKLDVEYDGTIEFTDDDKGIKSISRGGYFRIRSVSFGRRREVLAESQSDGIIYEYYVRGRRADFNDEGKKWLADILIDVIRATGMGAEARVKRFYDSGGVDAVLKEVDEIESNYASHIYLEELLYIDGLSDQDLLKLAKAVPELLESDYYITEVFKNNDRLLLGNEQRIEAFISSAMDNMDSDYYIHLILKRTLRRDVSTGVMNSVVDKVSDMKSDYYKASVLEYVFGNDLTKDQLKTLLSSVRSIRSDYYKSQVLEEACRQVVRANDDELKSSFRDAARAIRSDTYYGRVARCVN